eukprot:GHRR01037406.1.p1 GENE.GHRR01037406.1~~GHRR01037406.1.p1  ORF type:complete len:112 (-),score=14.06 GHRR01037406.1:124-459(-)
MGRWAQLLLTSLAVSSLSTCTLSLQDTVETVMGILGMNPCEGTEAVPPHARSHTVLLAGIFPGDERALVRWVVSQSRLPCSWHLLTSLRKTYHCGLAWGLPGCSGSFCRHA